MALWDSADVQSAVWPQNTPGSTLFDCATMLCDIEARKDQVFFNSEEIDVTVIERGNPTVLEHLRTLDELQRYLNHCIENPQRDRIFQISQDDSWSPLNISVEAIRRLLASFSVTPGFWNFLRAFGEKTTTTDESYGGYQERNVPDTDSVECCYLAKHTAEHGRKGPNNPWSLRQIGVYHKAHLKSDYHTFIVINPSRSVRHLLEELCVTGSTVTFWKQFHGVILSCITDQWKWHISYLEDEYNSMYEKALLSSVEEESTVAWVSVPLRFSDTQELMSLRDTALRVSFMLRINHSIIEALMRKLNDAASPALKCDGVVPSLLAETTLQQDRVKALLERIEGTSRMMKSILEYRELHTLQTSTKATTAITGLVREDNQMMAILARKSRRDARTLKTLTLLAMVYLPGTFVATLLGMNYIRVDRSNKRPAVHFAAEMWIFLIATLTLTVLTLGTWRCLDRHRNDDEELGLGSPRSGTFKID